MELNTYIPEVAVPGEPEEGETEFSAEEIILFAAEVTGMQKYVLTFTPILGIGA